MRWLCQKRRCMPPRNPFGPNSGALASSAIHERNASEIDPGNTKWVNGNMIYVHGEFSISSS